VAAKAVAHRAAGVAGGASLPDPAADRTEPSAGDDRAAAVAAQAHAGCRARQPHHEPAALLQSPAGPAAGGEPARAGTEAVCRRARPRAPRCTSRSGARG
jgi:hypothetical protein